MYKVITFILFMKKIDLEKLQKYEDKTKIIEEFFLDSKLELEVDYESDFLAAKYLREFVENISNFFGFSNDVKSRIILLTDELNNNAIEYWTAQWWRNIFRIKLSKNENGVVDLNIEVEDTWDWKSPKTALDMETMRAHKLKIWYFWHNSIRWRWLFLIAVKVADRLYFKNSKNWGLIVGIKKKIDIKK